MQEKRVELLAPAGNYESFLGALHAGADAVYLAGQKFGARAFAGNFSTEELCRALRYAHLFDKKVYLTLNTLIKEAEFAQLPDFLHPFYEEGLDGIIVQDMGVLSLIREEFPKLPIHISTQAAVTGVEGAMFLKEQGAVRVVPARELKLSELEEIKRLTGLELETFIHGAMCYSYSGQCLFSSIVGGRSGNRGRCAQPCRLPYQVSVGGKTCFKKEAYPLSLKDQCTIELLPSLLQAGIDSFKIEGRMKKPEYAAGVTAIYRKYIDAWYEQPDRFLVTERDKAQLASLYMRSELQDGYYFRQNGKEMISLDSPAYSGSDEEQLQDIRRQYLLPEKKLPVTAFLYCHQNEPLTLTFETMDQKQCVTVKEAPVQAAIAQPAEPQELEKRIGKLGNTFFELKQCRVDISGDCFVPVKELNDLRRQAAELLEDAILKQKRPTLKKDFSAFQKSIDTGELTVSQRTTDKGALTVSTKPADKEALTVPQRTTDRGVYTASQRGYTLLIHTREQWNVCYRFLSEKLHQRDAGEKGAFFPVEAIYIEGDLLLEEPSVREKLNELKKEGVSCIFGALPFVIRQEQTWLKRLLALYSEGVVDGFLVRNFEAYGFLQKEAFSGKIALDAGMYTWNRRAVDFFCDLKNAPGIITLPYELNSSEKKNLQKPDFMADQFVYEQVLYGRIPMMITANCLKKTGAACEKGKIDQKAEKKTILTDRFHHSFPVDTVCKHCYNMIWNCVPLSLHTRTEEYRDCLKRLQFTVETAEETERILSFYLKGQGEFPVKEYTTGHEKRGVE